jgi:hypothetical protein
MPRRLFTSFVVVAAVGALMVIPVGTAGAQEQATVNQVVHQVREFGPAPAGAVYAGLFECANMSSNPDTPWFRSIRL